MTNFVKIESLMHRMRKFLFIAVMALLPSVVRAASDEGFDDALYLYDHGMYAGAMTAFQSLPSYGSDAVTDGYAVLCAQKLRSGGYRTLADNYLKYHGDCFLASDVRFEKGLDLFDGKDWSGALDEFVLLAPEKMKETARSEYSFKKGYCHHMLGDDRSALFEFSNVDHAPVTDFSAPAWYCTGYIRYMDADFRDALVWFGKSAGDERFAPISNYYIIVCHYELKDYAYVLREGVRMYEGDVPEDRKAHLARIISESYLVEGDKENARTFYESSEDGTPKTRADFFYAGSLMFATGDWQGAVDNYASMPEKTDSLGQIAWYNTALSYINLKNKVSALDAFRTASSLPYDPVMTEDAMFNYAKLAFDLNGDTSVFAEYMKRFSDSVRGEMIYSYIALAALSDKDYQRAIDAYDKIEMLGEGDKVNYVKANYLRGAELMEAGSYRNAAQCMKAVTYYSDRNDVVSQLARFALAESDYRDGRYASARDGFAGLYNNSALYGKPQGEALAYNVAYSCLKDGDYAKAAQWFGTYCSDGGKTYAKDAWLRRADCIMALGQYPEAAAAYQDVLDRYFDVNDIYPYYRCAIASGLSKKTAKTSRKLDLLENVLKADTSAAFYAEAMYELGKTYLEKKKTASAEKTFDALVAALPASPYAAKSLLELGTVKRNAGKVGEALDAYCTVVEKMPESGYTEDALLAIESIYQAQNRPDRYFEYLEKIGRGSTATEAEREDMVFSAAERIYFSGDYRQALAAFTEFKSNYPSSAKKTGADYYIGECHRLGGDSERACDCYRNVIGMGRGDYYERALAQYAGQSFKLENFEAAYSAYDSLLVVTTRPETASSARLGLMRSAFKARNYDNAMVAARRVIKDTATVAGTAAEAKMVMAKSLLSVSRRDEAFRWLRELSADPSTPEGAEATYMIIQDFFDKGDFQAVTDAVYKFGESGTRQQYWLARAFIVLGDAFAEQGKFKQAEATFQSIADGYKDDEWISGELNIRLDRLKQINR